MMQKLFFSASAKRSVLAFTLASLLPCGISHAQNAPDRFTGFDAATDGWRASTNTALVTHMATGGSPDGYLRGAGPAGTNVWFFLSPTSWSGDWSAYRVLKFDFSMPSRHYPDQDRAGMVTIVGGNGQEMTWTGSAPLWTWTHYEVSLTPEAFGVDPATFNNILAQVVELRILAEFTASTETVGLDNVLLTATPPKVHPTDLVSRFTDGTVQGWRPVDDVTLTADPFGQPNFGLKGDDWMDGRYYKIATPLAWAGDWHSYRELSFDMWWTGESAFHPSVELVRIFGASGQSLSYSNSLTRGVWTRRTIPLRPESFGVSASELDALLAHVSEMWIFGEFGGQDDITYLDNVRLSTSTDGPPLQAQSLISRFDSGDEGWVGYDGTTMTWEPTNGISGGGLKSVDAGSGTARFQSPDAWSGDWRNFRALRFKLRIQANARADFDSQLQIATWNGSNLNLTLPKAWPSWTPYTVDLKPETFGVTADQFDTIMRDVACLWINGDLISGAGTVDTTLLDEVVLLTDAGAGLPPDRWCDFESGHQGWRYGGWRDGAQDWAFSGLALHYPSDGNPAGNLQNTDTGDWTYWFTPESWAGDWRGLEYVSFDFKILQGTALFDTRMISLCSPWTNLHANVISLPVPGQWERFQFALTPAVFGVPAETFERVMRDVTFLGIRSEWVEGSEREALDNVRLSKASDAYWDWILAYYTGSDLEDEAKVGRYADPDGDAQNNWGEYIAGTNPTDRFDYLRLHATVTNGVCTLSLQTVNGRIYEVEWTENPGAPGSWSAVGGEISGNGSVKTLLENATGAPRFYRLKVRLAD